MDPGLVSSLEYVSARGCSVESSLMGILVVLDVCTVLEVPIWCKHFKAVLIVTGDEA